MFEMIKEWRDQRILDNSEFTVADWQQAAGRIPILDRLTDDEMNELFELATLFWRINLLPAHKGSRLPIKSDSLLRYKPAYRSYILVLSGIKAGRQLSFIQGLTKAKLKALTNTASSTKVSSTVAVKRGSAGPLFCHGKMLSTQASVTVITSLFTSLCIS